MNERDALENLLPSLTQCFSVILIGYLAVKLSLITSQATAIGTYVTKFALPALFFRSMATINFTNVNWMFILAIFLSKFILFSITFLCTILITRPINFGMAGILSMFITQSNDVALGYPILLSLYPDLAKYIYLFAPAQLVLINPLCFILLECHEYRCERMSTISVPISFRHRILLVFKNVMLNPLVYMTVIGVMFNFIFSHKLPIYLDKILQILADSFAGVTLFYLGMNMVGKIGRVTKRDVYLLVFLLLGKLIFLPFLNRELVVHLINFKTPSNQSLNFSLVAFIYGSLPTAPPVFLIAHTFQVLPDLIATGLVLGTFISGPLMFITARVVTMAIISKSEFDSILASTALSVSVISICGCIWVIIVFLLSRRFKNPLHKMTLGYIFYVMMTCSAVIIERIFLPENSNTTSQNSNWNHYFQFSLFFIGCIGTRLCTVLLAAILMIIKIRSIFWLIRNFIYFIIIGLCLPVIITVTFLIFSSRTTITDIDPTFKYGRSQLIISLVILTGSIISTIVFLIFEARSEHSYEIQGPHYSTTVDLDPELLHVEDEILVEEEDSSISHRTCPTLHVHKNVSLQEHGSELRLINSNHENDKDNFQINRHLVLTIILVVSMGFGWFLCLWRLIKEEVSGIYVELEFVDCVFNFGQGFIVWMIFGLDTELIIVPFKRRFLKLLENIQEFYTPNEREVSNNVQIIKKQFSQYHLEHCRRDIVKDVRHLFELQLQVFTGKDFIDWIVKVGLANNRVDGSVYGQALLIGGVLEHINELKSLKDNEESLYRFIPLSDNINLDS